MVTPSGRSVQFINWHISCVQSTSIGHKAVLQQFSCWEEIMAHHCWTIWSSVKSWNVTTLRSYNKYRWQTQLNIQISTLYSFWLAIYLTYHKLQKNPIPQIKAFDVFIEAKGKIWVQIRKQWHNTRVRVKYNLEYCVQISIRQQKSNSIKLRHTYLTASPEARPLLVTPCSTTACIRQGAPLRR